jgi:serine/threonine protein kinase
VIDRSSPDAKAIHVPILRSLLRAVIYLHSNGLTHANIQTDNVLVNSVGQAFLSGFDLVHESGVQSQESSRAIVHLHQSQPFRVRYVVRGAVVWGAVVR